MKFAQGLVGTAVFADQSPSPYAYDTTVSAVSKFPTYPEYSYHFFGTRGSLAFPSFTVYSNSTAASSWYDLLSTAAVSDVNNTVDDPISREIEHFAQVLSGKEPPHATVDDAIRNLAVVEAIRRSLQLSTVEPVRLSGD
jgi:predicted dehydrogenase